MYVCLGLILHDIVYPLCVSQRLAKHEEKGVDVAKAEQHNMTASC